MNWGFICLIALFVLSVLSVISALSMARWGNEKRLRDMPYIKSMKAQFEVYGKVRKSIKKSLEQDKGHYEELSDRIEKLDVGDGNSE